MASATSSGTVPDTLQYALHEEGRIRNALKKNSSTGAMYYALEYDYFLKDHLGNIRTVITEGKDTAVYVATMEAANQTTEQALFDNEYDPVNTVVAKPVGFDTNGGNTQVTKLNSATGTNKPTGPGLLLKVMAGDKIQMSTYAWYNTAVQPPGGANPFTDLLSVLTGSVIGNSGGKLTTGLTTSVSNAISPNLTSFINNRAYNSSRPKAYLNWILLDEQMNYVSAGSNATQIPTVTGGAAKQAVAPALQTMPKSGYLYVYVSNESTQDVYFDDITVQHFTGTLVSEESYYAFGESMAALKSSAALKTQNCYKFNAGTELNESFDVDYYETAFRNYDAQIGRFTGVDAMAEETMHLTPYQFGGNDPIAYNDPTGLLLKRSDQMEEEGASGYGNWDDVGNSFNEMDQELAYEAGIRSWADAVKAEREGSASNKYGGVQFHGAAARSAFIALLNAINNPKADGSWSITYGTNKQGSIGFWEPYSINKSDYVNREDVAEVGTKFVSWDAYFNEVDQHIGFNFNAGIFSKIIIDFKFNTSIFNRADNTLQYHLNELNFKSTGVRVGWSAEMEKSAVKHDLGWLDFNLYFKINWGYGLALYTQYYMINITYGIGEPAVTIWQMNSVGNYTKLIESTFYPEMYPILDDDKY